MRTAGQQHWGLPVRKNYQGKLVPAAGGVFIVLPALALYALAAALAPWDARRVGLQGAAVALFAGLGLLDDLYGSREFGGLRGHVTALLRQRRVTTGLVKLAGGTLGALAIGWLAAGGEAGQAVLNGALIALAANVVNLLDLRPGRALKAFALGAAALAPGLGLRGLAPLLAIVVPAAAYAPLDLRARVMMGDTGANALGAALGAAAALYLALPGKLAAFAVLAALQVASEFVSFQAAIECCRPLRYLDGLGRQ